MPTQRFFNLPGDKKERITNAIIHEFSKNGIDDTDIASIVKRAGIPRGSFYQYFKDMDDVIFYIVEKTKDEKIAFFSDALNKPDDMSFVDYYRRLFMKGLEFAERNPDYMFIGSYFVTSRNQKVKEFVKKNTEQFNPYFESLIEEDIRKGKIRKDVDKKAVILMVSNMTSDVTVKMVFEERKNLGEVRKIFDGMLEILKKGTITGEE